MFLLSVSCKCWVLSLITEKCNSVKCVNSSSLPFYFQKSGKGNWEWTKKLPLWLEGFKMVLIWGALLPTKYADILVLTNPLPQCSWGTSPGGGSLLFVFCLSSDSKQKIFFIPNHAEWDRKIFEVCLARSLYWRRNLGTSSHLQELKSLMLQSGKNLFSLKHLKSLTRNEE